MLKFQFESITAFFEMAPHGQYVWSVYVLGLVLLVGLARHTKQQHRNSIKSIRRIIEREGTSESDS